MKETNEKRYTSIYEGPLFRRLTPYLGQYRFLIGLALFLMLASSAANVLHPYLIKVGLDKDVAAGDLQGLYHTASMLLLIMIAGLVLQVGFTYAVRYLGQRLLFDLRLDIFRHLLHLSNDYFDTTPVGNSLTHVTNDVEAVRDFISEGVLTVLGEMIKLCFIIIAMLWVNYRLALLTFITVPLFVGATMVFRKTIRSGFRGVRKANAEINTALVESITGIREIIQFNYKNKSKSTFDQANVRYLEAFLKVVNAYSLYFPVLEIVSNLSMVIILYFAHKTLGVRVLVGEIFAFFFYINMFFRPLRQLAEKFNMFQSAMAASERIFRFLDRKSTITEPRQSSPRALAAADNGGKIEFRDVGFAYNPDTPVLTDLSFTIQPGEKVALVGHTGSGKSTVINLVNRLYDVTSGAVLIDDVDCRDYPIEILRRKMSTIPQDPFIFTGTVEENISLHHPLIDRDRAAAAARQVYAHEFIEELPARYDEQVMEEGKRLSMGQRQLISFARAFVHGGHIIILDEATSNIDSETERLIEAATANLLADKTAIIIAHRLSTIQMVDRILVLHKGKLVEEGRHNELLQKKGIYHKLYHTQAFLQN